MKSTVCRSSQFGVGLLLSAAVVLLAGLPRPAFGAPPPSRTIQVDVPSMVDPGTAVGMLISADGTIQKLNPTIESKNPGIITISFPAAASELRADTVATAMVVSKKGEVVFGPVRPVSGAEVDQSLGSIPLCPDETVSSTTLASQVSLLEELYRIRLRRRDQAKAQAGQTLSGDLLERLQKLERGFGLAREKELSANLPVLELVDRLSRIQDALRSWEKRKEAAPTVAPTPAVEVESLDSSAAVTPATSPTP